MFNIIIFTFLKTFPALKEFVTERCSSRQSTCFCAAITVAGTVVAAQINATGNKGSISVVSVTDAVS